MYPYYQQPNYGYSGQRIQTTYYTLYDPYVVKTLQTTIGSFLVVETTKDSIRGKLIDVKPDHIVLQAGNSNFFIRIQEIVSVMPDID